MKKTKRNLRLSLDTMTLRNLVITDRPIAGGLPDSGGIGCVTAGPHCTYGKPYCTWLITYDGNC